MLTLIRRDGRTTCCNAYTSISIDDGVEYCKVCFNGVDGWEAENEPEPDICEATGGEHVWTDDAGEITARYGVSVYCDECHRSPRPEQTQRWREHADDQY